MLNLSVNGNVIPIGQFKATAAGQLRRLRKGRQPLVITQNGRAAAVVLAPADFDVLMERARFVEAVTTGLRQAEAGQTLDDAELDALLAKPLS